MTRYTAILILILAAVTGAALEARPRGNPEIVVAATVAQVVDGDTVVIKNGDQIRLTGIQAPKLPLGRRNFPTWPLAGKSKDALTALTLGKRLALRYDGRRIDRHGRLLAHLFDGDGTWIQGEMISRGLARVYSFRAKRARTNDLLVRERAARAARRGIWAHPFYRVLDVTDAPRFIDTFQLVEGRVLAAAVVRRRGYLNFGSDWKHDFTISIAPRARSLFRRAGLAIASYQGKRVRVRGWLKSFNGPMIEATHPEQIEVLGE